MAWRDWFRRRDAPPALPGPVQEMLGPLHMDAASILNTLTGLGGFADKGAFARPNLTKIRLSDSELTSLYLNNGIAQKIVRIVPEEATRNGWKITDGTEDADAVAEIDRELHTQMVIRDAMVWSRLYGSSVVLMVTQEDIPETFRDRPDQWLKTPLDPNRVEKVLALHAFDALEATPALYEGDIRKVGYREPLIWNITPSAVGVSSTSIPHLQVHASRILHFRGVPRPPSFRLGGSIGSLSVTGNNALDDSVLQATWDQLRNLDQTMAAGAVLAQEIRENVLTIGNLDAMVTADQREAVESRISLIGKMKSLLGVILLGQTDSFQSKVNAPTGFRDLSAPAQAMLSAVTEIPLSKLFGFAPSGLSTDDKSGRENWNRKIHSDQEEIRPNLEKYYEVVFVSDDGPTGGEIPEDWKLDFLPLDEPSQAEQAETRKVVAETDAIYIEWGVLQPKRVTLSRFGPESWQFELLPPDPRALALSKVVEEATPEEVAAEVAALQETTDARLDRS